MRVQMAEAEVKTASTGYPMPGDVLDERYRLEEIINAGGMGVIMRARQLTMDRDVAVKLLLPDRSERETTRTRFTREVHLAKQLTHPNTIRLYDYGKHGDFLYLVMELLEGRDLKAVLQDEGPLAVARALDILVQAADAVSEAHDRNIVHRDIKPGNLFIQRLGSNRDFVKVLDFGIAKSLDSHKYDVTSTGEVSGTVAYLSPEIVRGQKPDKRADVYALGVLFMEMITGRKIFEGVTVAETLMNQMQKPPQMPPSLLNAPIANVMERALTKDPNRRYQDAGELLAALNPVVLSISPTLRVSEGEIDATYGPRLSGDSEVSSSEALPEPTSASNPKGTQVGYAMPLENAATVRVRTNEELGDQFPLENGPDERSGRPVAFIAIAVLLMIGVIAAITLSPRKANKVEPDPLVAAGPPPDAGTVQMQLDMAFVLEDDAGSAEPPENIILPARDALGVALDLASGVAQLDAEEHQAEEKAEQLAAAKPRPVHHHDKPKPKEPEKVEKLDVFGSMKKPEPEEPARQTPAELRAAANKAFLAGDYEGCIAKCKEALAGGESSCHALMANAYRQLGETKAACRQYKAAGIAHKSCITLQSR